MKKYLIIFQTAPYAEYGNLEAMELALSLAAFAQPVTLVFLEDAVLHFLKDNPEAIGKKDFTKVLTGLDLFDITEVYLDRSAFNKHSLRDKLSTTKFAFINHDQVAGLITQHDVILRV